MGVKRYPYLSSDAWVRKCQECGLEQECPRPTTVLTDAYRNRKCKRCKSEGLDYGQANFINDYGDE